MDDPQRCGHALRLDDRLRRSAIHRSYYDRPVTFDSWLLALHLLFAAVLVGAVTIYWILILVVRSVDRPTHLLALTSLLRVAGVAVVVGSLGTVILGVWLAITLDAYHPWDGWVIAAIVLLAIAYETGRRADLEYDRIFSRAKELVAAGETGPSAEIAVLCRLRTRLLLQTVASAAVLLILVDMIWKPGA